MIEYTLEWLAMNKVEEVFVFCCAHADQIKRYLAESKWAHSREMTVTAVVSTSCLSAGEALRLIDQKDIIKSDFVLVSGDTVSNMNLAPVLEAHRARRAADKSAIFTMIMKSTQHPRQRARMGDAEVVVALDPATQRLLKFHEAEGARGAGAGTWKVDAALYGERDAVQVRTDLLDTHIAICAPEVLLLFSDNFDYQHVKRDFVAGVLSEEELGNKLYVAQLGQAEYAARIHNLRSYDAVSRDIMQRWVFPMVPDTNVLWRAGAWGAPSYRYARGHRYTEANVGVARTAVLGDDVCVGAGASVGEHSRVVQSVVGRNCRIGKGCDLVGCYLQDGVCVQDGAVLRYALVCEGAVVGAGAVVERGAIISYGVVVGPKHTVPPHTCLSLCKQSQQTGNASDDELEYTAPGKGSAGGATGQGSGRLMQGRRPSNSDDSDEGGSDDDDGYSDDDPLSMSLEKPTDLALKVAEALAMGRQPEAASADALKFDAQLVGQGGAGYAWVQPEGYDAARLSIAPPTSLDAGGPADSEWEGVETGSAGGGGKGGGGGGSDSEAESEESVLDPEASFKREVSETFLRCVKLRFDQTNAVIELNGLKIAEDRSFADCARYIFTTMTAMCAPAPAWVKDEYAPLFPARGSPVPAKAPLLAAFRRQLKEWGPLLQRFLRSEDDQVELLLTFEEYCAGEGVFEGAGEQGAAYGDIFEAVLKTLYDEDVLSEDAILSWADEKAHADEEEKVYLKKAAKLVEWLRTEDDDDEDDDDEDDD